MCNDIVSRADRLPPVSFFHLTTQFSDISITFTTALHSSRDKYLVVEEKSMKGGAPRERYALLLSETRATNDNNRSSGLGRRKY